MSVFIDTNYYFKKKFNFQTQEFKSLIAYCDKFNLKIVIPEFQVMEIEKKVSDFAKEIYSKHLTHISRVWVYDQLKKSLSAEYLKNKLKDSFDKFTSQLEVEILQSKNIDLQDIVKRYCGCKLPFSQKKPKEFMDALIAFSLNQKDTKYVISIDNDLKLFFKQLGYEVFSDCRDLLDHLYRSSDLRSDYIDEIANDLWPSIQSVVEERLLYNSIYLADTYESEIEVDEVEFSCPESINIVEVTNGKILLGFAVTIKQHLTGYYADDDCGMWDSEEKRFIVFDPQEISMTMEVLGSIDIEIHLETKDLKVAKWEINDIDEFLLNDLTLEQILKEQSQKSFWDNH